MSTPQRFARLRFRVGRANLVYCALMLAPLPGSLRNAYTVTRWSGRFLGYVVEAEGAPGLGLYLPHGNRVEGTSVGSALVLSGTWAAAPVSILEAAQRPHVYAQVERALRRTRPTD